VLTIWKKGNNDTVVALALLPTSWKFLRRKQTEASSSSLKEAIQKPFTNEVISEYLSSIVR
jgi:hypothetical protein